MLIGHRHQLGELSLGYSNSVATDLPQHQSVKNEEANDQRDDVKQDCPAGLSSRQDDTGENEIDGNADEDAKDEIDLFLGVNEQVHIDRA